MGHHDGSAAPLDDMKERPDGAIDAEGVTDRAVLYDVVIETDEDDLAGKVGVLDQRKVRVHWIVCHGDQLFVAIELMTTDQVSLPRYHTGIITRECTRIICSRIDIAGICIQE